MKHLHPAFSACADTSATRQSGTRNSCAQTTCAVVFANQTFTADHAVPFAVSAVKRIYCFRLWLAVMRSCLVAMWFDVFFTCAFTFNCLIVLLPISILTPILTPY